MPQKKKKPLVIKIGSAVLLNQHGRIDEKVIENIVLDIAHLHSQKQPVCIVSSGAIGAGMNVLQKARTPRLLKKKQALAAIGQVSLMNLYQKFFSQYAIQAGQVLLSHGDFRHRESFLNTRETICQLLDLGIIPIVNENDTVSTEEIQFGDNDQLAILIANAIESDRAIFLSTTDGLMDFSANKKIPIPFVETVDQRTFSLAKGGNKMGTGGMGSKLMAIHSLTKAGKSVWLAHGKKPGIIRSILAGENVGTLFMGTPRRTNSKKQWMRQHLRPYGSLELDGGAYIAVHKQKASLLSPGVRSFSGSWESGNLISLCYKGKEFARGMARISDQELTKVLGKKSREVAKILKEDSPHFVIHRNDIALVIQRPQSP